MPKYDFACTSCGTVFEQTRSFAQGTDDVVCPDDGAEAMRLFSPPMDVFVYGGKTSQAMNPPPPSKAPPKTGPSFGHGHSHAPGTGFHSH
jgi:putative FmdB family regulatory protein